MQRSNCPECGAVIGGEQHALVASNRPDETMTALEARTTHVRPLGDTTTEDNALKGMIRLQPVIACKT